MTRLSDGPFGPARKKLSELSDQELRAERTRRHREERSAEPRPSWQRVKQYFANLELSPGATWPDVERAYHRLLERYHPSKHQDQPDKHETAEQLNDSLNKAYRGLRRYFGR